MKKIRDKAIKQCKLYAECALHDPELKHRLCAKIWAFQDIGILSFAETLAFIDAIMDNAREAERRSKKCM